LKNQLCDLEIAENGQIGLEQCMAGQYDLVLMDVQMPVMDGLTATRAIRAWERANFRPPTPIVALTANAMAADVQQCLEAGCTSHLAKPIKKPVLLEALRRYVADPQELDTLTLHDIRSARP
jgi:CheY-like chemotaxis protein